MCVSKESDVSMYVCPHVVLVTLYIQRNNDGALPAGSSHCQRAQSRR